MNTKKNLSKFFNRTLLFSLGNTSTQTHTRTINPKFGLFGLLGFTGFLGFIPHLESISYATFFFVFFGFFGFYYEGKMSNTLMDERFISNRYRADALAHKIALNLIFIATICFIEKFSSVESLCHFLLGLIGIALALDGFLQQYLLYRFENEE
ncbi:MAG: DUF3796 domain-containing protein [Cellulosilyticum sp.]|nr:DUF3796 domain-containing protein [Cellulosilyticum sp.]